MKSGILKKIIPVVIVLALGVAGYFYFSSRGDQVRGLTSSLVTSSGENPVTAAKETSDISDFSQELLILLGSLERIDLDVNNSIFFSPAFRALRDISIPLLKEGNEGRENPFAPIGLDATVIQSLDTGSLPTFTPTTQTVTNDNGSITTTTTTTSTGVVTTPATQPATTPTGPATSTGTSGSTATQTAPEQTQESEDGGSGFAEFFGLPS